MTKVINEVEKFKMLTFTGIILGSIVTINEKVIGLTKGTIVSEASFRSFIASKGDNSGKTYGVLECKVELESGNTVKCRIDPTFDLQVGDIVTVD
jgi:hypothetical protein